MNGYLLDSNHASALMDDKITVDQALQPDLEIFLCATVVAELWFMTANSTRVRANADRLRSFLLKFRVIVFDSEIAEQYGYLRRELNRAGLTVGFFDMQIAATARHFDLILLTNDNDFRHVSSLRVENWLRRP